MLEMEEQVGHCLVKGHVSQTVKQFPVDLAGGKVMKNRHVDLDIKSE